MKILHLRLENFRGIRELDIDFDGKNADIFGANGTGKTTIANAITWLFCDAPATEEKDFSPKTAGAHDLHHKAEMTVEKDDGERFTFAKDYYEKWTKKRGSASRDFSEVYSQLRGRDKDLTPLLVRRVLNTPSA